MSLRKTLVTLEVVCDDEEEDPADWNWEFGLELVEGEHVRCVWSQDVGYVDE